MIHPIEINIQKELVQLNTKKTNNLNKNEQKPSIVLSVKRMYRGPIDK